ncbi:hypothetical protein [Salinibacter ruber]|jgi:hypothetical protein|uniref:DNA-directed DNA polymerase family A palm domain-containing protein n=1 Tax=Salinibacter ruber TaxID=146919 RepID=A0AAW5P2Q2_9BACT|nr:hypothetical protein [Salinibacter ruber]MCS4156281.1 hypothetical protein [Salinibacter ruber]MCS4222413.1 hypothetical protein [Salinibacter ruber]
MANENDGTRSGPGELPIPTGLGAKETGDLDGEDEDTELLERGQAVMAVSHPWRRIVSKSFAEAIRDYPGVEDQLDFRLLATLILSIRHDISGQHIAIPYQRIAECMGLADDIRNRNVLQNEMSTGSVLEDFVQRVLPEVEIIPHDPFRGLSRELAGVDKSIPKRIINLRNKALLPDNEVEKVHLEYKIKKINGSSKYRKKKEEENKQKEWIEYALCEPQRRLLRYLYNISKGRSSAKFVPNKEDLDKSYRLATDERGSLQSRFNALDQVNSIGSKPVPRYTPSYEGGTVRVFTKGYSYCTISKDLRRALQPDWIELDLASAQLAIVAHDWGLSEATKFLKSGGSIWESLYRHMGWEDHHLGRIPAKCAKPALKKGLYSIVFGAGKEKAMRLMGLEYADTVGCPWFMIHKKLTSKIFEHPLIKELLQARKYELDKIKKEEGATDTFGRDIKLDSQTNSRSILAQLAQSQELKLLLPALKLAENELKRAREAGGNPRFWIVLWQHDGFSVHVRDQSRRATHVKRFQEAVNSAVGDYHTRLEVDYPEGEFDD